TSDASKIRVLRMAVIPSFPGSAWERTVLPAPPALLTSASGCGYGSAALCEAEPRGQCVPRRSLATRLLRPAAQVLLEDLLRRRVELQPVLRPREAVPLVGEHDVFDRLARLLHGSDDLVALRLLHARILRPLADQQRYLDAIHLEQRRP